MRSLVGLVRAGPLPRGSGRQLPSPPHLFPPSPLSPLRPFWLLLLMCVAHQIRGGLMSSSVFVPSVLAESTEVSHAAATSSCPTILGMNGPPSLTVRVGAGYMADTGSSLNLSEVVWVGPECLGVFTGSPTILQLAPNRSNSSTSRSSSNNSSSMKNTLPGTTETSRTQSLSTTPPSPAPVLPSSQSPPPLMLAAHDYFGASTRNVLKEVFASSDGGVTWRARGHVQGIYWANLFQNRPYDDYVYMLGTNGTDIHKVSPPNLLPLKGGPVVITRSKDAGLTWCPPVTLFNGSFATGPTPIIRVNGTLYRSMEGPDDPDKALVIWARADADLLSPASWSVSHGPDGRNGLMVRDAGPGPNGHTYSSWQEGSAVEGPDGAIVNLLRLNGQSSDSANAAAYTQLDTQTGVLKFVRWVQGPFSASKFVVRRHYGYASPPRYFALSTNITQAERSIDAKARNNLVLSTSPDLRTWHVCRTLARDDTGFNSVDSAHYTGFEYPDWQFDDNADRIGGSGSGGSGGGGGDIVAVVRTAYRGAVSAGSSNRMTFMRVRDYAAACDLPPPTRPA